MVNENLVKPCIGLPSGDLFYPTDPDPNLITTDNICLILSRTPRWAGCLKQGAPFWSVLQHSVCVAAIVPEELKLAAYLHDAHEAFTGFGDVAGHMKQIVPILHTLEKKLDLEIAKKYKFPPAQLMDDRLHHADMVIRATERKFLMHPDLPFANNENEPDPLDILPVIDTTLCFQEMYIELTEALK